MVVLRPFRALTYAPERVGGLAAVTAPPYDIVTEADRRGLAADPENIVHVTMPQGSGDAKYAAASDTLQRWAREKTLVRRPRSAFFCYRESYTVDGRRRTMTGLAGILRLDPEHREVLPHERTHAGPKEDRLKLWRATLTDTEPIHLLYEDPAGEVEAILRRATKSYAAPPLFAFSDERGWDHEVWAVEEPATVAAIEKAMAPRPLYIADGHHRYETACRFAKEMRARHPGAAPEAPFEHKLVVVASLSDPGLTVQPTHRLLSHLPRPREEVLRALRPFADLEERRLSGDAASRGAAAARAVREGGRPGASCFGVYWGNGRFDRLVVAHDRPDLATGGGSATLRRLDVSVLHQAVLPGPFGIREEDAERHLRYTREDAEAIASVDSGAADAAVFVNACTLDEVRRIADAREHMPQKSTFFLPKLRSGLFLHPLAEP